MSKEQELNQKVKEGELSDNEIEQVSGGRVEAVRTPWGTTYKVVDEGTEYHCGEPVHFENPEEATKYIQEEPLLLKKGTWTK